MIRTLEAVVDEVGSVRLLEPIQLPEARRAYVMILDDSPSIEPHDAAILSECALAEDWDRPEEDDAWSHLHLPHCVRPAASTYCMSTLAAACCPRVRSDT
jgi:hypothetical protein